VATESGERTRIRIGPVNSKQEAEKLRARLSALGLSGTLVPLPS
jgi:DedD protein